MLPWMYLNQMVVLAKLAPHKDLLEDPESKDHLERMELMDTQDQEDLLVQKGQPA